MIPPANVATRASIRGWLQFFVTKGRSTLREFCEVPKGPQGQKRPADVIGNAVKVMRIATGEEEGTKQAAGVEANRKGGLKDGVARAKALAPEQRAEIARTAADARWKKS